MKQYLQFLILLFCCIQLSFAQYNFNQIDIWTGSTGSSPKYLTEYNGELYFQAYEITPSFKKLYKSNGTEPETSQVATNLNGGAGYSPESLTVFNGELFFTAFVSGVGTELYKTDGTESGTMLVKDIRPGGSSGLDQNTNNDKTIFVEFNNALYFRGSTSTSIELWKTDGTETGTLSIKNFEATETGAPVYVSNNDQQYLGVVFNNELFFTVNRGSVFELWKTNGTTVGTELVRGSFVEPISNLIVFDNQLFFTTAENATGNEIWTSDGTTSGTQIKFDIFPNNLNPAFGLGSIADDFYIFNNEMYFKARSYNDTSGQIIGSELWKTDGTITSLVKNINTTVSSVEGSGLFTPRFFQYQSELFFLANDDTDGDYDLWKTDGTEIGTIKVIASTDTGETFQFYNPTEYNGKLFYFNFQQLWVTDGTAIGTEQLSNINTGSNILLTQSTDLLMYDNKVWFSGFGNTSGYELTSIEDTTLSVDLIISDSEISIFPNPVKDKLHIDSDDTILRIEIYSLIGQKIMETHNSHFIDLSSLNSGYYMLKIVSNRGIKTTKIIKS